MSNKQELEIQLMVLEDQLKEEKKNIAALFEIRDEHTPEQRSEFMKLQANTLTLEYKIKRLEDEIHDHEE